MTVVIETNHGTIEISLNTERAPVSSQNFLQYVDEKFYDGTIFHRVIPGFMVQGGGMTPDMKQKPNHGPIKNEAKNGLKNDNYTVAMARTNDINSATSQFFINVKDNNFLNYQNDANFGYAVFGHVTSGMNIVDKIKQVETTMKNGHQDVPAEPVMIQRAYRKTPKT